MSSKHTRTVFEWAIFQGTKIKRRLTEWYRDGELSEAEVRHETVHLWQQAMLLVVGFYVLYLTFWAIGLIRYRDAQKAYRMIPFEQSAYQLERREGLTAWEMGWNWMKWKIRR